MSALTLLLEHAAEVARTQGTDDQIPLYSKSEADEIRTYELQACEEALRLGLTFDEKEEAALSSQLMQDEDAARKLTEDEERAVATVNAQLTSLCQKDEALARKLADELQKEEERVQSLDARARKLAGKELCKTDYNLAAKLAADIEAEEREMLTREKRDRQLARSLVRQASKGFMQADKESKQMCKEINGKAAEPTMRMRLREKLGSLRRNMNDITNQADKTAEGQQSANVMTESSVSN